LKNLYKDKKIILTGAGGHLGSFLLNALKNEGFRNVFAVYRKVENKKIKNKQIEIDLTKKNISFDVKNKFRDAEIIINLAALVPKVKDLDKNQSANNLRIIENLVFLCPSNAFILNCSSAEVYGPQKINLIHENVKCNPTSSYGKSKLAVEKFLSKCRTNNPSFCFCNLRLTNVFGPGEAIKRSTYLFIESALNGQSITIHGDGRQRRNYIYINDAVNLIISLIKLKVSELPKVLNVASPNSFEIRDIVKAIKRTIPSLTVKYKKNGYATDSVFDIKRISRIVDLENFIELDDAIAKQSAYMSKILYFDLDGTLLNVNNRIYNAHQIAAQLTGLLKVPFREYIYAKKNKLHENSLFNLSKTDKDFLKYNRIRRGSIEKSDFLVLDTLRPRILKSLLLLKNKGYLLNLITARKCKKNLNKQLDSLKIKKLFSSVIVSEKKSDSHICKLKPGIFFTDTDEDFKFGFTHGMYVVGIAGGMRNKSILKSANPDILCDSISDALEVLRL